MAILDPLYGTPLAVQLIPQVDRDFAGQLKLRGDQRSIGLLSVDNDDATYTAIDEATKMADVEVVYAAIILRRRKAYIGEMVRGNHGYPCRTRPG